MDTQKESQKLAAIIADGQFRYRGINYTLDINSTDLVRENRALTGQPFKKLVGTDERDNSVIVWSHDCETVPHIIAKVDKPKVVSTSTQPKKKQPEVVKKIQAVKGKVVKK